MLCVFRLLYEGFVEGNQKESQDINVVVSFRQVARM
jgi:hypothetical protein